MRVRSPTVLNMNVYTVLLPYTYCFILRLCPESASLAQDIHQQCYTQHQHNTCGLHSTSNTYIEKHDMWSCLTTTNYSTIDSTRPQRSCSCTHIQPQYTHSNNICACQQHNAIQISYSTCTWPAIVCTNYKLITRLHRAYFLLCSLLLTLVSKFHWCSRVS